MCTLLAQCASPRIGCWHSRGCAYTASRAWAVKRDHAPSQYSAGASLLDRQAWWYRVTNVGPVRHRAIDSSELRLTTDREGRQVGQHRSHIVAAVSSACLIARAAASGSQGRIVSSLSPGRPRADVGLLSLVFGIPVAPVPCAREPSPPHCWWPGLGPGSSHPPTQLL